MKNVFIPWSGGMDSTYLIQYYYEKGYSVSVGYINLDNNLDKTLMEKAAINRLLPILKKKYEFIYLDEIAKINLESNDCFLNLTQPPIWLLPLLFCWRYDEIAFGYVMNDTAISWIKDIENVWEAYSGFYHGETQPLLSFPLIKTHKIDIWNKLLPDVRQLCVFCEHPIDDELTGFKNCGECEPCKRHLREIGEI